MNTWIKRIHLVFTIGGGFTGFVVSLTALPSALGQKVAAVVLVSTCAAFYVYAIVLGVRMAEGRASRSHLLWFYGLQLLVVSSPLIAYQLSSGAHFNLGFIGSSFNWNAQLGANYSVTLLQNAPWGIGVNLIALTMFLIVSRSNEV